MACNCGDVRMPPGLVIYAHLATHSLLSSSPSKFHRGLSRRRVTCAGERLQIIRFLHGWVILGFVFHLLSCRCFLLHGIMHAVQDSLVNKITCCTRCAECHKYVKYKVCCFYIYIQLYHLGQTYNKKQNPFNTSNKQQHFFCVITDYFSSPFQMYMLLNFRFTGITTHTSHMHLVFLCVFRILGLLNLCLRSGYEEKQQPKNKRTATTTFIESNSTANRLTLSSHTAMFLRCKSHGTCFIRDDR